MSLPSLVAKWYLPGFRFVKTNLPVESVQHEPTNSSPLNILREKYFSLSPDPPVTKPMTFESSTIGVKSFSVSLASFVERAWAEFTTMISAGLLKPFVFFFRERLLPRSCSFGNISSTGTPRAFASRWRVRYEGVRLHDSMFEIVACATPVERESSIWDKSFFTLNSRKRLMLHHSLPSFSTILYHKSYLEYDNNTFSEVL